MGINKGVVLDLINDLNRLGGFKDYNSYQYLFSQVDTMYESKDDIESHWIPVTERLPEESGLYQVTDMQGHVVRYVFNANESSVEYWRRCVKAWMPLPESYKGVTE